MNKCLRMFCNAPVYKESKYCKYHTTQCLHRTDGWTLFMRCAGTRCEGSKYCKGHKCPLCNGLLELLGGSGTCRNGHKFELCNKRYGPKNIHRCHELLEITYDKKTKRYSKQSCNKCKCQVSGCNNRNGKKMYSNYCPEHTCQKPLGRAGLCNNIKDISEKHCIECTSDIDIKNNKHMKNNIEDVTIPPKYCDIIAV